MDQGLEWVDRIGELGFGIGLGFDYFRDYGLNYGLDVCNLGTGDHSRLLHMYL